MRKAIEHQVLTGDHEDMKLSKVEIYEVVKIEKEEKDLEFEIRVEIK